MHMSYPFWFFQRGKCPMESLLSLHDVGSMEDHIFQWCLLLLVQRHEVWEQKALFSPWEQNTGIYVSWIIWSLRFFRGQQPPQPQCSFCWHPLGRTDTTKTAFLKPGDPQAPKTGTYCVQGNSELRTVEATSGVKCIYRKQPNHTKAMFRSYIFN